MDCIAQIVNSSKLRVNFSQRIRMDSIQSQCSAIWTLFKSHVIKLFLILLWTQISNFGHFGHFDFGHKSTQNPGAMPQLWHLTLATCPRICGTSTKMTVPKCSCGNRQWGIGAILQPTSLRSTANRPPWPRSRPTPSRPPHPLPQARLRFTCQGRSGARQLCDRARPAAARPWRRRAHPPNSTRVPRHRGQCRPPVRPEQAAIIRHRPGNTLGMSIPNYGAVTCWLWAPSG